MISDSEFERHVRQIRQCIAEEARRPALMHLMTLCCRHLVHAVPSVAVRALEIAEAYWLKAEGDASALEAARVECWRFLDQIGASADLKTPRAVAVRAVICTLYAESDESYDEDGLHWFVTFLNELGDYSACFSECVDVVVTQSRTWPDDADGDVLRRMKRHGFDFSQPCLIDFNVEFESWPPPEAAVKWLESNYPGSKPYSSTAGPGYIQFQLYDKLTYDLVMRIQRMVSDELSKFGGVCDSWGVLH